MISKLRKRKRVGRLVKLLLTFFFLYLVSEYIDWQEFSIRLAQLDISDLALPALLVSLSIFGYAIRWVKILQAISVPSWNRYASLPVYFESLIFGIVTPGGLGADAYRVAQSNKLDLGRADVLSTIILEKLFGFAFFALLAFFFVARSYMTTDGFYLTVLSLFLISVLSYWLSRPISLWLLRLISLVGGGRFLDFLVQTVSEVRHLAAQPFLILNFLFFSFLCILLYAFGIGAIASSLGYTWFLTDLILLLGFIEVIRQLPVSLHGLGVREGLFAFYAIELWGWSFEQGVIVSGVFYVVITLTYAATGSLSMLRANFNSRAS